MVGVVIQAMTMLESALAELEPGTLSGDDAAVLMDTFAKGERLCAVGKALCAKRATEASVHLRAGHRSAPAWLAARSGDSLGQAAEALCAAEAAHRLPVLDEALRRGELGFARAAQVVSGATADPGAEAELVRLAKGASMKALRDRAAQVRATVGSAAAESARYEAIRASRYLRHWSQADGAFRLDARLCPDDGAKVLAQLEAMADRIFCAARAAGAHESPRAYGADALVSLVTAGAAWATGPGSEADAPRPPAQVAVRVDAGALRRGFVQGDEICEIPGVGPVSVASARALLGDAWLALVIADGVAVTNVCHLGRTVPAHLRSALAERDPSCVVPGCEVSHGLEIDHWRLDFADGGPTELSNLARLCHHHHLLKTHRGYRLEGGPGRWSWVPPRASPAPPDPPPPGAAGGRAPPGEAPTDQPSLFDATGSP
jgi:hypothetical protein